ncbi:MAG: NRDE family protein [Deltaproteobacteria bacterium]|nr:NRDE family protein [Candidatus Anaeroferrophillus wilburensis]MBN2888857.1 NRDE family protein [Deltaproteobacteria bacterium]
MCTILLAYRVDEEWPIIIGNNRDEALSRTALPPRVFSNGSRQRWIAPLDLESGGSWWACNQAGLVICLTNRWIDKPADETKISRGHLVRDLIQAASLDEVRKLLSTINLQAYNPFNLLVMGSQGAFLYTNFPRPYEIGLAAGFHFVGNGVLEEDKAIKSRMARGTFAHLCRDPVNAETMMAVFRQTLRTALPQEHIPPQGFNVSLDEYGTTSSTILAVSGDSPPRLQLYFSPDNPLRRSYDDYSGLNLVMR